MKKTILRHAILYTLFGIGISALAVSFGDAPQGMGLTEEIAARLAAFGTFCGCIATGRACAKKGLLPGNRSTKK